ncbi:MAG: TIGR00730 family Rossman fold protein [Paramuribaculum sp.]|nr:TIGR00730 family Rossman fold protein [Paramuribaculum sp.]MDE5836321.1 TIGR00730 family Rossman fold protein [Paramuribaculum sp.]
MELQDKAICVYGASRDSVADRFKQDAFAVGELVARKGMALVSGGGRGGLMASAINGALSAGGKAIGVLPEFMVEKGWQHEGLTQMITCPDMHTRKRTMAQMSAGVIALPGGVGTLEELLEIITWRQLHLYSGTVVILNTDGFYDPLLEMFAKIKALKFMRPSRNSLWIVADSPEAAVEGVISHLG